jgi:hypothetical protein
MQLICINNPNTSYLFEPITMLVTYQPDWKMSRQSAVVPRQKEVLRVTKEISATVLDGCIATKNGRPQQKDGRSFHLFNIQ